MHEVKFDGYPVQAHKAGSRAVLLSRNGHDFTERFPPIAQLLHELPAKVAVLDGEVVAGDADGRPNFARLHVRWTRQGAIHLWALDLLVFNGCDLRPQPLVRRLPSGPAGAFRLLGYLAIRTLRGRASAAARGRGARPRRGGEQAPRCAVSIR